MKPGVRQFEAIVLRMVDYGESDRIVTLLTPEFGRISAFAAYARKSKRRFNGGLDLFSSLQVTAMPPKSPQSQLWRMTKMDLLDPHWHLRKDLKRLAVASYLAECLVLLGGEGDPQPLLFAWWKTTLKRLADPLESLERGFQFDLELFSLCGFAPRWDRCTVCGRAPMGTRLFFSFPRGGVACQTCRTAEDGLWLDAEMVRALATGTVLPTQFETELGKTLDGFMNHTLGREPRSQKFRNEVWGGCS